MYLNGQRVRKERHLRGLEIKTVAKRARMNTFTWSKAEHGRPILPSTAAKKAAALDLKIADLYCEEAEETVEKDKEPVAS